MVNFQEEQRIYEQCLKLWEGKDEDEKSLEVENEHGGRLVEVENEHGGRLVSFGYMLGLLFLVV